MIYITENGKRIKFESSIKDIEMVKKYNEAMEYFSFDEAAIAKAGLDLYHIEECGPGRMVDHSDNFAEVLIEQLVNSADNCFYPNIIVPWDEFTDDSSFEDNEPDGYAFEFKGKRYGVCYRWFAEWLVTVPKEGLEAVLEAYGRTCPTADDFVKAIRK